MAELSVEQSVLVVSGIKPVIVSEYPSRHLRCFCLEGSNEQTAGVI
ncbi:hypothetical protein CSB87_1266 [Acinetobacter sp. AR_0276]|nr:hypothetical protein CSB87_1266 [Acinetobacter sp. AR_0276]